MKDLNYYLNLNYEMIVKKIATALWRITKNSRAFWALGRMK